MSCSRAPAPRALPLRLIHFRVCADVFLSCVSRMLSTNTRTGREQQTKANSMQIRELGAEASRRVPMWREHQLWLRGPSRGEWERQQPGQEAAHIKYIPGSACRPGLCLCIRRCSRFLGWWRQGASTGQESPGQSGTCRLHPWG